MASRREITEALRWCSQHNIHPAEITGACATVGIKRGMDTGDMIVVFVDHAKSQLGES